MPWSYTQGDRLKDLGCLADECFEVAWVPSGELAAVFEACGWRGPPHEGYWHVSEDGHVLGAMGGGQAGEGVVGDYGPDPMQAVFNAPMGANRTSEGQSIQKSRRKIVAAREGGPAVPLHVGLDHGDGGKARKARLAREAAIGQEPGHVMADDVAPDLDAAMVAVGGGVPVEFVRGGGKEAFDLAVQVRPVVFHRDQVVRALSLDGVGDLGLAAHGI